jgi:hypothetical protein
VTTSLGLGIQTPREGPGGLLVIPRQMFCGSYLYLDPGDHVVFGGPSTHGKTRLAFDCARYVISPDNPIYVAQSKPRDPETDRAVSTLGLRVVNDWPVPPRVKEMWDGKPNGYVIRPKFGNINTDMPKCAQITARLLADRYTAGASKKGAKGILMMDDTMVKAKILGLDRQMVTIVAMAGAMGIGEWIFVQKPTDSGSITLWAYENATHCFFTKGGDSRMLKRYAEIAGEHGKLVMEVVPQLREFQFLYLHKVQGWICIVDKG